MNSKSKQYSEPESEEVSVTKSSSFNDFNLIIGT
ncbi:hypothetical protein C5L28_001365, partial [Lentilactobacillus parakefiri]